MTNSKASSPRRSRRLGKVLVRIVYLLVVLLTVGCLGVLAGKWWYLRQWPQTKAEFLRSARLSTWEPWTSPPIPDAENFAASPIIQRYQKEARRNELLRRPYVKWNLELRVAPNDLAQKLSGPAEGRVPDFEGILAGSKLAPRVDGESAAAAILRGLKPLEETLREITEAAARPSARYRSISPDQFLEYEEFADLPLHDLSLLLSLRATARIEEGDEIGAASDVVTLLRLATHASSHRSLLGVALAATIRQRAPPAIWFGAARGVWRQPQLDRFEAELARIDALAELHLAVRSDSALALAILERLASDRHLPGVGLAGRIMGSTAAAYGIGEHAQMYASIIEGLPSRRPEKFDPLEVVRRCRQLTNQRSWSARFASLFQSPPTFLVGFLGVQCTLQSTLELTLAAVRLERTRLAMGRYSLANGYQIPNDLLNGEPTTSECTADGSRFRLKRVWWSPPRETEPVGSAPDLTEEIVWHSNLGGPEAWK